MVTSSSSKHAPRQNRADYHVTFNVIIVTNYNMHLSIVDIIVIDSLIITMIIIVVNGVKIRRRHYS